MSDITHLDAWYNNRDYNTNTNTNGNGRGSGSSLVCMTISDNDHSSGSGTGTDLSMVPCDSHDSNQILTIERTTVSAWLKYMRVYLEQNHYMKEFEEIKRKQNKNI